MKCPQIIVRKKITCGEKTISHISQNVARVQIRRRSSLSVLFSTLRVFSYALRFSSLLKKKHFEIPIRSGMVDEDPIHEYATCKSILIIIYLFDVPSFLSTAWVGSLATGIMFFLGPLTTSLCERCGCRIVIICGVLICIAGLLLSSIVTTLFPFYFTYGLMFGTGTSLCYFPTIIVLSKYFKRRIAVVNGLVTAGSGVGTLVMGPSVQALFLRFGVADTFRIVAGIFILVLLCGATFRPVPTKYSQHHDSPKGRGARRIFEWSIFKNKGYVIWVISLATFQLGYFVPFVHLVRGL